MTDQHEELRSSVVAAVQQELSRYNEVVSAEIQRLRADVSAERAARARTEEQLLALMPAVERSQTANSAFQQEIQRALEARLSEIGLATKRRYEEIEDRIGRIADETNAGLAAGVASMVQPIVRELEHRQEKVEADVGGLDRSVRKFDEQAARMVQHLNVVTEATEARMDEVAAQVSAEIDGRVAALATRLDELSAQAARQQSEVANVVGTRVDQAEARINERLLATEARVNEGLGQRVADIDAYVGRVSASLDEAVTTLSDRIADAQSRFHDIDAALVAMNSRFDEVDVDAISDMKDRMGGIAGEVELIRIETERFQASIGEVIDKTTLRLVDLETQLQEQHLDVETAVQLDRLEEVERALIALDPNQFVRKSDLAAGDDGRSGDAWDGDATSSESGMNGSAPQTFSAPKPFSSPLNGAH